jgi:hypothetical protein
MKVVVAALACASRSAALDIESFEFNDADGTTLAGAANGVNPGNNWFEDTGMAPSDIRSGAYNIVKQSAALESNYLQITDITSGTRYLVARMSGWDFYSNPGDPNEEFRLALLNDDTGNSGSTITAQVNIRRDAGGSGNIVLVGSALGAAGSGFTNIPGAPVLNTTQTNPFLLVLELNKTANSYKVFYKDGTNPTQVLGLGSVDPARGGNSIRMAVNNNFGNFSDDYPIDFFEIFSIDRIALTDTNPVADLISLEVDRGSASMTLRNTSGATISGIESYSITSATGALNPAGWNPGAATPTVSTNDELAATFSSPISLTNGQTLPLSMGAGAWLKSPFEDLQMVLNLTGGATRTVNVNFLLNGGLKWKNADFDFNNAVNTDDWLLFIADAETDLAGMSRAEAYQSGDLDGDGFNSISDFVLFEALYDAENGAGSFDAMIARLSVPEPASVMVLSAAALFWIPRRRRKASATDAAHAGRTANDPSPVGDFKMPLRVKSLPMVIAALAVAVAVSPAGAVILEDFPFSDGNGTTLDSAANAINAANTWQLGGNSWDPSVVNSGAYRITKSSTNLATAHLDMANVTTGKVWLVAEMSGWNYTATASSPSEEVRLAFLDNDNTPASGSTITAQMQINRSGGGLALAGNALGTGSTNITGSYALPLVQTNPFTMVLELDKDADQYLVYYKDGDAAFAALGAPGLLGTSTLNAGDRDGNSIRFAATGTFSDAGEFFDINRIYLTDTSPIGPVGPTALTLEVKSNGEVAIRNDTETAVSFNSYRIGFDNPVTDDLNFAGWNSLSDQGIDAVSGGDDPGETWDEAGGSNDKVLAESFLLGSSAIAPSGSLPLGSAFKPGGAHEELVFQYYDINTGTIVPGDIDFVVAGLEGDYNGDGKVDAADYVVWRKDPASHGGDPGGYDTWRANYGMMEGSGSSPGAGAVPEPGGWWLAVAALVIGAIGPRRSPGRLASCAIGFSSR